MKLVAACAFGLEAIVKRELQALGYEPQVEQPGRIAFEGDWSAVARSNLWLRTADRILIKVMQFEAADFDALFDTVKDHDWSQQLPADANFPVTGRSRLSQLSSVPAVQRSVKRAVVESLKREHTADELTELGPLYKLDIALLKNVATVTIDTTGPSLHKRGYRKLTGAAPIKETLAAAMVDLSVWNPQRVLVDPFCGTGTIPIEAALIGLRIAPGLNRDFTFTSWPDVPSQVIDEARQEARDGQRTDIELQITGTDRDDEALEMARYHARVAGVEKHIHFQQKSFDEFRSKREYGCVITNPPYGERLDDSAKLLPLYQSIPMVMQRVPTWSLYVLTSMPDFQGIVQKSATRRRKLFNGRHECTYYQYLGPRPPKRSDSPASISSSIDKPVEPAETIEPNKPKKVDPWAKSKLALAESQSEVDGATNVDGVEKKAREKVPPVFGGLQPKDQEQADLFRSRLVKRARHLRRWPTRRGITCFRIYERDIPEIPLIVDRYGDSIHITRYERPHDRELSRDAAWMELMKRTAAAALETPIQRVFIKSRVRDDLQYEKIDTRGQKIEVVEGELKFLVNMSDYVDTGLFLDHRNLRQLVREQAAGKDFLNLFAYTGSFSVYAAAGGAKSTTTVDLSENYLDWAQQNLRLNGFEGASHQVIASDVLTFLTRVIESPAQRFDLTVVDPPTFSNSKRTNVADWDVQQQHVDLLTKVRQVMRPGGTVYFSNNFRRFKLDETALADMYTIREISNQTVPEDFRNKRIHRCWQMTASEKANATSARESDG